MELTQEIKDYFESTLERKLDEKLANFVAPDVLGRILDEKLVNVITKEYLDTMLRERFTEFTQMVAAGFSGPR